MATPVMILCKKCRAALQGSYWLEQVEGTEEAERICSGCGMLRPVALYKFERKQNRYIRRQKESRQSGPPAKDTRAHYRGRWRSEE